MRVLKTAAGKVFDVAFSHDCRAVAASVYRDPSGVDVYLWNLDSPTIAPVRLEAIDGYWSGGLNFSAGGRELGWLTLTGRRAYDRDTRTATTTAFPLSTFSGLNHACDAAGVRAVSVQSMPHHSLTGWRLAEGEWVPQWQTSTRALSIGNLYLAPTGDRFATLTRPAGDGRWWEQPMRLEVRDATTGVGVAGGTYPYSYAARPLRFHPHGEQIAGVNDMTLLAWPLPAGGDPRLVRNDNRKHFTALAYHPNGRVLFVTSNDATVHAFDTQTLDRVNRYTWHLDKLNAVAVSPDGTLAAAGSANGDVVVWDLDL